MTVTATQSKSSRPPANSGARTGVSAADTTRTKANAFPRSVRLLKHAAFQHVYEKGRKHFSANMIFFYLLAPIGHGAKNSVQVGLTVGRALGGAVGRNRIKRRIRDVVRHNLAKLQAELAKRDLSAQIVINPKRVALTADIAVLRTEVERGFAVIAAANVVATGASRSR